MVKNTKLGEEIESLVNEIQKIRMELDAQSRVQQSRSDNVTHIIIYLETLISLLIEKKVFTKDEFKAESLNIEHKMTDKKTEMLSTAKKTAVSNYLNWLLTHSKNIGNA